MTNVKVKVTKEVAEAIELRKQKFSLDRTLEIHIKRPWQTPTWTPLNALSAAELAIAWLVGYEIEEVNPNIVNQRIKEIGETVVICSDHKRILDAEMRGIKLVVDAFNLKGVNA